MFRLIKRFIRLLTSTASACNYAKCISLNNHQCMTQSTLINLHSNEDIHGLHYYPSTVSLENMYWKL